MKIAVDLQSLQSAATTSRGIGRYITSFLEHFLPLCVGHEVFVIINDLASKEDEWLKPLYQYISKEHVLILPMPWEYSQYHPSNAWKRRIGRDLLEFILDRSRIDAYVSTLFVDGYKTDMIIEHPRNCPSFVISYDLIPLIYKYDYFYEPFYFEYYAEKLDELQRFDRIWAISQATKDDLVNRLGIDTSRIDVIGGAVGKPFSSGELSGNEWLVSDMGIKKPFIMYTGNKDKHKNIQKLIQAYSLLPRDLRKDYQLVVIAPKHPEVTSRIRKLCLRYGLYGHELVHLGGISDQELMSLYAHCELFVFPSYHEGFGLPILEAMTFGAPVCASDTSSLPEVVGRKDVLFAPHDEVDMMSKMRLALEDREFNMELREYSRSRIKEFSWTSVARKALDSLMSACCESDASRASAYITISTAEELGKLLSTLPDSNQGVICLVSLRDFDLSVLVESLDEALVDWPFEALAGTEPGNDRIFIRILNFLNLYAEEYQLVEADRLFIRSMYGDCPWVGPPVTPGGLAQLLGRIEKSISLHVLEIHGRGKKNLASELTQWHAKILETSIYKESGK